MAEMAWYNDLFIKFSKNLSNRYSLYSCEYFASHVNKNKGVALSKFKI